MSLIFSFDIGYASIGWGVVSSTTGNEGETGNAKVLGSGVVTFPTDDCLASKRRGLRRMRRHIRSTRLRIERMKRWLLHRGMLSRADLDRPGHPAPFLLAAAALQGHRVLNAWELWTVLRWYAHNRGYDGNARWAGGGDDETEDTEKVNTALTLMSDHGTETMAETICACLKLLPSGHGHRISSTLPYKTLNAAWPRRVVTREVERLLEIHLNGISGLDAFTTRMLMASGSLNAEERANLDAATIRLPLRYQGGLLFGQLAPRFDNRIIARCPITWAKTFDEAIAEGKSAVEARKLAEKYAKVPAAKSQEFLGYRFARLLANLKIDGGAPLPAAFRRHLWNLAGKQGRLTKREIAREMQEAGYKPFNLDSFFNIHPDAERALTLDPVLEYPAKNQIVSALWPALTESVKTEVLALWKKGGAITPGELRALSGESLEVAAAVEALFAKDQKTKSKRAFRTIEDLWQRRLAPAPIAGRAPYARPVLRAVIEEVLEGWDSTKAAVANDRSKGENKPKDGILYALSDPKSRVTELRNEQPLAQQTNNHLVRHRLLILGRLVDAMLKEYGARGEEVAQAVVEVGRELREFSGKTQKEISADLNHRLKDFKAAVAHLDKYAPHLPKTGSLIRKCRLAMDLGWKCPFTGDHYDAADLPSLEREHIIPYSARTSNALHAMVLTWPAVNRMKGKRTARKFIEEFGGRQVEKLERLSLMPLKTYDAFVDGLDTRGHPDDARRKRARKALLAVMDYEDKELGFTDGQMTQSSHLMKLATGVLRQKLPDASIDPVPGQITGEVRKAWRLLGILTQACPEVIDQATGYMRPKDEIRGITHLHHALDALTLGFIAHCFPFRRWGRDQKGRIWQAILKRRPTPDEILELRSLGMFNINEVSRLDKDGIEKTIAEARLRDLKTEWKDEIARSLCECRVMQHVPSDRSGSKADLNAWGVVSIDGEGENARVKLRQSSTTVDAGRRVRSEKVSEERAGKLVGISPRGVTGKLKAIGAALVISENYGLILDPSPEVIPFHNVTGRLEDALARNHGRPVRLLRNGMLIRLKESPPRSQQDYSGVWRIASIKNNKGKFLIDMIRPHYCTPRNGVEWAGMNKTLGPLLECGLEILPQSYIGQPLGG